MHNISDWKQAKKVLCIRPDNLGDVLMTQPALRALKQTYNPEITMLTSHMGAVITPYIPEIDHTITYDVPWIKGAATTLSINQLVDQLHMKRFDGAIIFTSFSQNPLPTVMIPYLANIPLRLSYCHENPYDLLTHWVADKEPFYDIRHGVERNLDLLKTIDATTSDTSLSLSIKQETKEKVRELLCTKRVSLQKPWVVIHPGVSEPKRQYPAAYFIKAAKQLRDLFGFQIVLSGSEKEKDLTSYMQKEIGSASFSLAGETDMEMLIALIQQAPLLIGNNTGPVHIAAAVGTPVIDMYARTNPEHTPWNVTHKVLYFDVPDKYHSKNTLLEYVAPTDSIPLPTAEDIVMAVQKLLRLVPVSYKYVLN